MSENEMRSPLLGNLYQEYLDHQDSAKFIAQLSQHYTTGTLERMADSPVKEVRRAAVLALGLVGDYTSNYTLGRAMLDDDRTVRLIAQNGIRSLWNRSGGERERQLLAVIVRLNASSQYDQAIERASELIEMAPWFAEVWHQRGEAHFQKSEYQKAIADCHQALEINPYHFIASTCMGQSYVALDDPTLALECFRRALRVNPDLEGVRAKVIRLAKTLEE